MRTLILGAGAIGCYVGGRLAAAGQHVSLVGRPRVLDQLSVTGLRVSDPSGFDVLVPPADLHLATSLQQAFTRQALKSGEQLLVLVCTKATATAAAAAEIAQACPAGTVVISLQNGVENAQRLKAGAPEAQVLAGIVPFTVGWRDGHLVVQANRGKLQIERSAQSEALAPHWRAAGVEVELHDDMLGILWGKLLLNLLNPINALAKLPIREQLLQRGYRRVLADLQTEALNVLKTASIRPAKVAAAPPRLIPWILRLPDRLFTRVAAGMLKIDPAARTSMCYDLQAGRATEIDELCVAVLRLAADCGLTAPRHQALCALIKNYQAGQNWSAARVAQALDTHHPAPPPTDEKRRHTP